MKRIYLLLLAVILPAIASAQITTSAIGGKIADQEGEALIGAAIVAVHEPSGTQYGAVTNVDGRYSIEGMRPGGPYKITMSYVGLKSVEYRDVTLQLGEMATLDAVLRDDLTLNEVVVTAASSKFTGLKTGASTNVSKQQLQLLPSINRSLTDFTRMSPYSGGGTVIASRDGRTNTFTVDGANLNNNFGLSGTLPGGGNPISLDAIEELQVVVAPFDVRQTNFMGGGINAITKSGTNTFKGTAYTYHRNENLRGNTVDGYDLGDRARERTETYGFTLGGPIIKNKLFFFINGEYENSPNPITKYHVSTDGVGNGATQTSRVTAADMEAFAKILRDKYGYDPGSYTDFSDGGTKNYKALARLDWNINDDHKLSVRFNYTTNSHMNEPNWTSGINPRASSSRISDKAFSFRNACYGMDNNVWSVTGELNSRFSNTLQNRVLFTYSDIHDKRSSDSKPFPFIDIWDGKGDAFMTAGYELFTWNNEVKNNVVNLQDHVTWTLGSHRIIGGLNLEYQKAGNSFMRFGTGYYKYASFDDFKAGNAPIAFGLTYGYNGEKNPIAEVSFLQSGLFVQDEWNVTDHFKLTYGLRADMMNFLTDLETNQAYLKLDWRDHFVAKNDPNYAAFQSPRVNTGEWPKASVLLSPRVGFNYDINGDRSIVVRGGTGIFTGRIPLVFLTNMPTNSSMIQNTITVTDAATLGKFKNNMLTDVDQMINLLNAPTTPIYRDPTSTASRASVVGIADNFKMPQIWKNTLAVDYRLPVSFPLTLTVEGMYNKDLQAVVMRNWNIVNNGNLSRFAGPDNRLNYATSSTGNYLVNKNVTGGGVILDNDTRGYSASLNAMVTAEPIKDLNLMFSYTHQWAKEITGLPGNQAYSTWQGLYAVDGPNNAVLHNAQYLTPDKLIASLTYRKDYGKYFGTSVGLYYAAYSTGMYNYYYSNDMNGDKNSFDLMYIPSTKGELKFVDKNGFTAQQQADAFWRFVEQDKYLSAHKGEYAEAYAAAMPWVHRFDLKVTQDFRLRVNKAIHTLQLSFDVLNIGNLLKSSWGVTQTTAPCNYGKILNYEGTDASGVPTYSMGYNTVNKKKELYTRTYEPYKNSSNCWQMQIGLRYIFN